LLQEAEPVQAHRAFGDFRIGWSIALNSRHTFARSLQFAGLVILPFGIVSELEGAVTLGVSMLIAAAGAGVFYVGYVLQHRNAG
jgi:hypothetical protein